MGKRLISQNRGRGTPTYRSPGAGYTDIKYNKALYNCQKRKLVEIRTDPGRSSTIAIWQLATGEKNLCTLTGFIGKLYGRLATSKLLNVNTRLPSCKKESPCKTMRLSLPLMFACFR